MSVMTEIIERVKKSATVGHLFLLVVMGLLLTSCATTSMVDTWRDPNYKGKAFRNFLVVGITKDPNVRRVFEDIFTAELKSRGFQATTSYSVTPHDQPVTKELLADAVKKTGADAVITTRVVNIQQQTTVTPGYVDSYGTGPGPYPYAYPYLYPQRDMYSYYGSSQVIQPPTVQTYEVATLETVLFDVADASMVWSGTSTTFETSQTVTVSKDLSKLIIQSLVKAGLI
jgi:uncharacterized lipoprotein YajG